MNVFPVIAFGSCGTITDSSFEIAGSEDKSDSTEVEEEVSVSRLITWICLQKLLKTEMQQCSINLVP